MSGTKIKRRKAREVRLSRAIRVRIPEATDRALRAARSLFGVKVADVIRMGIERQLGATIGQAVEAFSDPELLSRDQLRLIGCLHQIRLGHVAIHRPDTEEPAILARRGG